MGELKPAVADCRARATVPDIESIGVPPPVESPCSRKRSGQSEEDRARLLAWSALT